MKVTVFTDGAVRTGGKKGKTAGHDGRASCACVIRDEENRVVRKEGVYLGTATVNEAEYSGLILGLYCALEEGATHVTVKMDSQLVINQANRDWICKEQRLKAYLKEALSVAENFEEVEFVWIPREQNQHADSITGEVLDDEREREG